MSYNSSYWRSSDNFFVHRGRADIKLGNNTTTYIFKTHSNRGSFICTSAWGYFEDVTLNVGGSFPWDGTIIPTLLYENTSMSGFDPYRLAYLSSVTSMYAKKMLIELDLPSTLCKVPPDTNVYVRNGSSTSQQAQSLIFQFIAMGYYIEL